MLRFHPQLARAEWWRRRSNQGALQYLFDMNFNESLKDVQVGSTAANGLLLRTDRLYPCVVCGKVTGWRYGFTDSPGAPCCGDECLDKATAVEEPESSATAVGPSPSA